MEDFRSAMNEPEFGRVTQVASRNRRTCITKGVRTVGHRLIFKPKVFMLHMHIINAERFTAIINGSGTWTIRIRQRIPLGQEISMLIDWTESFVSDLMIDENKFPEIRSVSIINHHLPATRSLRGWARA